QNGQRLALFARRLRLFLVSRAIIARFVISLNAEGLGESRHRCLRSIAVPTAHPPRRSLPPVLRPHLRLDICLAEAGAIVPCHIVGSHTLEAEQIVFVNPRPGLGPPMEPGLATSGVLAAGVCACRSLRNRALMTGVYTHQDNMEGRGRTGKEPRAGH